MKIKRILTMILSFTLASILFVGCSSSESKEQEIETKEDSSQVETRVIIDHTGKEIELPKEINRVVISSILPLPSVYCFYRGSSEGLVGMHPSSMAAAQNSFLVQAFPELEKVDTSFVNGADINVEQLMNLKPDIVLYNAANTDEAEMYENAGIKAVGFSTTMSGFNTIETYANWVELLGQIFGETEKANDIIDYGRKVEKEILEKSNKIQEADKPKVLILFKYENGTMITSGKTHFGQYWIESAGGINVAQDLEGTPEINMEQVYEWNPDMIFITNFSSVLPEDLLENKIDGIDWSKVKAVQDKKVYKFPLGMYRWYPPSSDTPLSLMWLAKTIQPEVFQQIDMDKEMKEYYKTYYNIELNDEDLNKIYHPAREASGK